MNHQEEVIEATRKITHQQIEQAARLIYESYQVFIIGNGGSFATAEHFSTDLHTRGIIVNTPNIPLMSARANDIGYSNVFNDWLANYYDLQNKLLVAISVSGNSQNIINALRYFKGKKLLLAGNYGLGKACDYASVVISVESERYEVCEDAHSIICHAIVRRIHEGLSVVEARNGAAVTIGDTEE